MMRKTFSSAMTLVLVSAASFYWSRQVEAANWYGATSSVSWCHGNMQDNGQMTYHRSGLSGGMWEAVATTLAYDVSPTDIDLQSEHLSADVNTDVVYLESNYSGLRATCGTTNYYWHGTPGVPSGSTVAIGWAKCQALSGSRCQRFNVYFDSSWTGGASAVGRLHLACHESGHTVGLKHGDDGSCISASSGTFLTTHDRGHIDANY